MIQNPNWIDGTRCKVAVFQKRDAGKRNADVFDRVAVDEIQNLNQIVGIRQGARKIAAIPNLKIVVKCGKVLGTHGKTYTSKPDAALS